MDVSIRPYGETDAGVTLSVFRSAIRVTAAADYSQEQIEAWASGDVDLADWHAMRAARNTVVALVDGAVVGFTDVDESGYIDMLFVDPSHGGCGVATALMDWILCDARCRGVSSLTTHASITARSFFEAHSFVVIEERHPVIRGVVLRNYSMSRAL